MKILKTIGGVILVLLIMSAGSNLAMRGLGSPEVTPEARETTSRNAFISGCEDEEVPEVPDSFCGCAYGKLVELHPDFITNQEILERIVTEGYNSAETDALVSCL